MIFESLQRYDLESLEYGFMMDDTNEKSTTCSIMIPKLTPLMNTTTIQKIRKSFNPNIFINSSDTKPNVTSTISISNHIKVKKFNSTLDKNKNIGDRVICCIMNKDIRDIYLTDYI